MSAALPISSNQLAKSLALIFPSTEQFASVAIGGRDLSLRLTNFVFEFLKCFVFELLLKKRAIRELALTVPERLSQSPLVSPIAAPVVLRKAHCCSTERVNGKLSRKHVF